MKKIKEKKWGWSLQMITLNQGNIIYQVWPIWVAFAWKLYLTWGISKLIHMLIRSIKLWFNWIIKEVIFDPCMCAQTCLTLCNFMDCNPPDFLHPWNFPGKNTGVGCHFLLQRIFPLTLGWDLHHLHLLKWQVDSLPLHHVGSPDFLPRFQLYD